MKKQNALSASLEDYAPASDATTVILTGTLLSLGNSAPRTHFTSAAVQSIIEAIHNPDIGGHGDPACAEE